MNNPPCEHCYGKVGEKGPKDGWTLPDGSIVCHECVKLFMRGLHVELLIAGLQSNNITESIVEESKLLPK